MEASKYKKTKAGWYDRWTDELAASDKMLKRFMKRGDKVVKRFLDERERETEGESRLNLFHSNIVTIKSMMYGNVPKVEVSRTFKDHNDDVGRVAALLISRILNNDVQENGREYDTVFRSALEDRLVPGLGCARVRYVAEFSEEQEEIFNDDDSVEFQTVEVLDFEDCLVEYVHWRDVRWGWARNWDGIPWIAFRTYLSREEVSKRFGAKLASKLEYEHQTFEGNKELSGESDYKEERLKAEVWEIWDKETRRVFWYSKGVKQILDSKPDPLKLNGFFPCPPFFLANATTSMYVPVPDFYMAQDLYNEIDTLQTRINVITKAVKVVGVYDQSSVAVKRMLQEGVDNDLIPVDNWAMFAEKGGLKGVVDWFPVEEVVMALEKLEQQRDTKIALLFQVVGLSDIMRGQGSPTGGRVSAQEQALKAKFGSVRIQALQDEFGQFASDLMQLKAEVISKHFDEETILHMANIQGIAREDWGLIGPAMRLIKDWDEAKFRVKIRPESVAMVDYSALKTERTEYINALALFLQSAAPLVETAPSATPVLLELLKWGLAGFKGSSEVEGILDKAIEDFKKQGQQQQGDGEAAAKVAEVQAKAQADIRKIQATLQADIQKIKAKLQADLTVIQAKASMESQKEVTQAIAARMEELTQLESKLMEIQAQSEAKMQEVGAQNVARLQEIRENAKSVPSSKESGR